MLRIFHIFSFQFEMLTLNMFDSQCVLVSRSYLDKKYYQAKVCLFSVTNMYCSKQHTGLSLQNKTLLTALIPGVLL